MLLERSIISGADNSSKHRVFDQYHIVPPEHATNKKKLETFTPILVLRERRMRLRPLNTAVVL